MKPDRYELLKGRVFALSVALDQRDEPTLQHCRRVSGLSLELGRACGLSARELRLLQVAAAFHDVGKIGIPDRVLKKTTRFDADDWAIMRAHSENGERIVLAAGLDENEPIARAVRHHHERYDGGGYPDGLAGEGIPMLARIIAVTDTYDAMASLRHYGHRRPHQQIVAVLQEERGRQHDGYVTGKFLEIVERSPFRAPD